MCQLCVWHAKNSILFKEFQNVCSISDGQKSKQHTNLCNKKGEDFIAIVCICGNEHNMNFCFICTQIVRMILIQPLSPNAIKKQTQKNLLLWLIRLIMIQGTVAPQLGAGKGSLHLMENNRQTLLWHIVYLIETAPCTILFYYAQWPGANFILRLLQK